jgi:NAD(P)-dependent dehydrogenase (short-subunit alcohol dehydrogenase family)
LTTKGKLCHYSIVTTIEVIQPDADLFNHKEIHMAEVTSHPTAPITGGTTGIGFATACILHNQGFEVLVTGKNPETIAAAKLTLPGEVTVLKADSRVLADTDRLAEELKLRFGRLDFGFLNAGVGRFLPIEAVDEAAFDEHFDVNVKGQFFTLQKILPLLAEGGSVVFTSAVGAHRGVPAWSVYSATRSAIDGLVPALAAELAPRGIRVNAIRPGPIDTPAFGKLGLPGETLDAFSKGIPRRIPLGRFGTAEEVAEVVAFLASPKARYITGTTIDVDGGMSSAASVINLM